MRITVPPDRVLQQSDRVAELLSGKPGETRTLALIREGKPLTAEVTVRSVFDWALLVEVSLPTPMVPFRKSPT